MSIAYRLARPALFALEPETAHRIALKALAVAAGRPPPAADPRLGRRLLGLDFPNPLGMAAGFDKNGEVPDGVLGLGFGFTEVGTVTPVAQAGNPRPRVFRLPADHALINRLGFNNDGHEAVHRRLAARRARGGIVGVNVGANKDSSDRIGDFIAGVARFAGIASYLTVNVSSPNTPGLRDLQEKQALATLLAGVLKVRDGAAARGRRVPILLKIAPDLDDEALGAIAATARSVGIEGMIVSNTTLARGGLAEEKHAAEAGGLSGRPLFRPSTRMLAKVRRMVGRDMVLVGVGGVDSADTAFDKIAAGADLVQLYSGLVYEGPDLPARILAGLAARLDREGLANIGDAVGIATERWAED